MPVLALACASAHSEVPVPQQPALDARAYVLLDHFSGRVLAAARGRADRARQPDELMSAYTVFRMLKESRRKLDGPVTISERAWRVRHFYR